MGFETIHDIDFNSPDLRTLERTGLSNSQLHIVKTGENKSLIDASLIESDTSLQSNDKMLLAQNGQRCEDIEAAVKKLSLASISSSVDDDHISPFSALLRICGQSAPSMLQDMIYRYMFVPYFLVTCYLGFWTAKVSMCALRGTFLIFFYFLCYPLL